MRLLLFACLFVFCTASAFGQKATARTPAKILDFGQLYSTYSWETEAKAELRSKLGNVLAENIIATSTESSWPPGIASLNERTVNRENMAAYRVYFLTKLGENIAIIVVPAAENAGMTATMKPATDIYFVTSLSAVDINGTAKPQPYIAPTQEPNISQAFSTQFNHIIQDFGDGFVNLTNEIISEDEDGMVIMYGSKAPLEGSTSVYFVEDLLGAFTSFHAEFQGSNDPAVSLKLYRSLVKKIEGTKLSSCGLSKQDEQVEGNKHNQIFQAYDPAGKLGIAYQGMNIEVHIEQGEAFDANGQLVNNWIPVVSVYER